MLLLPLLVKLQVLPFIGCQPAAAAAAVALFSGKQLTSWKSIQKL
jgi:hypothetical protein